VTIPGFLVVAAVLYAVIASGPMVVIGRNFVAISESKNQTEAEYRYALMRVRENGESIALLGGEEEERSGIDRSFGKVLKQWALLCDQHMRTTIVSQGSSLIAHVIPILLCAPRFLEGSMRLGQVMQAASAFTIVQSAFGWLVDNYPRLAPANARCFGVCLADVLFRKRFGMRLHATWRGGSGGALRLGSRTTFANRLFVRAGTDTDLVG
jgi:vitamin B12/bleomycin/antimicrobial peptide transport system ATP-binding/permease protein